MEITRTAKSRPISSRADSYLALCAGATWLVQILVQLSVVVGARAGHPFPAGRFIYTALFVTVSVLLFFFWRRSFPLVAAVYVLISLGGTGLYLWELLVSHRHVVDFVMEQAAPRWSQVVLPFGSVCQAWLCWRDRRIPSLLAVLLGLLACAWFAVLLLGGQLSLQLGAAMVCNVLSLVAEGGLSLWLIVWSLSMADAPLWSRVRSAR